MDEVKNFFCQFPNPWALRVSGMGGYTSKCEKMSKSLHPSTQPSRLQNKRQGAVMRIRFEQSVEA
jgi:hypothetical protein